MTCSIRKAVQGDEQRICELFIEMLQTIYQTEDVQGYEPGYLERYWKNGEDIILVAAADDDECCDDDEGDDDDERDYDIGKMWIISIWMTCRLLRKNVVMESGHL